MREGGREGRGKESKNETRGMSSLFFLLFSFFFSLLKYVGEKFS